MEKPKNESFAERLQFLMERHDPPYGIKELADELQTSYEHVRKMVRGLSVPSHFIIQNIATLFEVDALELNQLAKQDNFKKKFGQDSPMPTFHPEVQPFAAAWHLLTEQQRDSLLNTLKEFLVKNRKAAVH